MTTSPLPRTLHTPRLTIRLADQRNDTDCHTILSFYDQKARPDMTTPDDIRRRCGEIPIDPSLCTLATPPTGSFHLIYLTSTPDSPPVGFIGFGCRANWPCPDIGYKLFPECRGKGYASEAGKAVLAFWKDQVGVKEICAAISESNVASWKVAERIGFVRDGRTTVMMREGRTGEGEIAYVLPGMEGRIEWGRLVLS